MIGIIKIPMGNFLGDKSDYLDYVRQSYGYQLGKTKIEDLDDLKKVDFDEKGVKIAVDECWICGEITANKVEHAFICKKCEKTKKKRVKECVKKTEALYNYDDRNEFNFDEWILSKEDWIIPGMGDKGIIGLNKKDEGVKCGNFGTKEVCKNFDGVDKVKLRCKKAYCPNCWNIWRLKKTFKLVTKIEGFAKYHNERPSHLSASIKDKNINFEEVKKKVFQKVYREIRKKKFFELDRNEYAKYIKLNEQVNEEIRKIFSRKKNRLEKNARIIKDGNNIFIEEENNRDDKNNFVKSFELKFTDEKIIFYKYKMGVIGGMRIFHPFRFNSDMKVVLEENGYTEKYQDKIWKSLRYFLEDNNLKDDFYKFVNLAYHSHLIVFPKFLEGYDNKSKWFSEDFVVNKLSESNDIESTIRIIMYQLSHAGLSEWKKQNDVSKPFGDLYNFDVKEKLGEDDYKILRKKIANMMGCKYDEEKDELIIFENDDEKVCSNCGSTEWISGKDMVKMSGDEVMGYYSRIKYNFDEDRANFFLMIYEKFLENFKKGMPFILFDEIKMLLSNFDMGIVEREDDPPGEGLNLEDELNRSLRAFEEKEIQDLDLNLKKKEFEVYRIEKEYQIYEDHADI